MILTKDLAEKAKGMIPTLCRGICWAVLVASDGQIDLSKKPVSFWEGSDFPGGPFKWKTWGDDESDEKRRAFIDSLIGRDL